MEYDRGNCNYRSLCKTKRPHTSVTDKMQSFIALDKCCPLIILIRFHGNTRLPYSGCRTVPSECRSFHRSVCRSIDTWKIPIDVHGSVSIALFTTGNVVCDYDK